MSNRITERKHNELFKKKPNCMMNEVDNYKEPKKWTFITALIDDGIF